MLWSCALLLVFISHHEVRWSRESDRCCVDSDCVCCRLQAVQVAHLWELSSTSHRREREGGVKRTENHGEQADSIRVPGCVHCAQKKTCEICVNVSLLWNMQWQMKQTADSISVFLKMSEDELMPNLRVSYFCLDETVAAVSTQHRASYQRNSRLPLIVEFWFFFFLSGFISMWISGFESFVFTTLLTPAGLTTGKNTSTASLWKRWTFCSRWRPNWRYTTKSVFIQDLLTYSRAVWTALTREKIQIYVICVN